MIKSLLADADLEHDLPLERLLWYVGFSYLDEVTIEYSDSVKANYDWSEIFNSSTINKNGQVCISNNCRNVKNIQPSQSIETEASIIDLASTITSALNIASPDGNKGNPLTDLNASHVVTILVDGLGYQIMSDASILGLTPNIDNLPDSFLSHTVYPPSTRVATSAFLTGAKPEENGVTHNSMRTIELQTLFSAIELSGKNSIAIEGESLPVNLIDTQVILSGDKDANGSTDDNVFANTIDILNNPQLPDFLFTHFHGIDDAGHYFGVGSEEHYASIQSIDVMISEIIQQLPSGTLMIIFADHGMHVDPENPFEGTHGNLIKEDMLIPIIFYQIP
ncbi:MAG: alkaline phosphatase family protein [Anaerolineaceae bacterium]|nr:alkaline phosphatase family protein [Anaerolineaceae bacterium]